MLIKASTLKDYKLNSLDGEIGKVKEFFFDDHFWTIRYLVANTGNWLTGRNVLISPYAMTAVNSKEQNIDINLTKKQIEGSPSLYSDRPVSLQYEEAYHGYYGWPVYWGGQFSWGSDSYIQHDHEKQKESAEHERDWDPNLRSSEAVSDYHIQSKDDEIGHVEDYVIDDKTWAIRYIIVDIRNWWPGKKVLISPKWIERINWSESKVYVNLSGEAIKQSPEYTDRTLLTREYETKLHGHYNRRGYWVDEPAEKEHSV